MKEADIDVAVGDWLRLGRALDPHYQVVTDHGRIDVVGRSARLLVAVESKVKPSLAVVEQALRWRQMANESWMATTEPKGAGRNRIMTIANACGLGLLFVNEGPAGFGVWEAVNPHIRHPPGTANLQKLLVAEQAATEPGAMSGYSTEWKRWAARFRKVVHDQTPITLKAALAESDAYFLRSAYDRLRLVQGKLMAEKREPELAGIRLEGKGAKAVVHWIGEDLF